MFLGQPLWVVPVSVVPTPPHKRAGNYTHNPFQSPSVSQPWVQIPWATGHLAGSINVGTLFQVRVADDHLILEPE